MMTSIVKPQSLMALLSDVVVDKSALQECSLTDISMDSRRVAAGGLFLALAKNTVDREKHLRQALEKDIFAVLIDEPAYLLLPETAAYLCANRHQHWLLGALCFNRYHAPRVTSPLASTVATFSLPERYVTAPPLPPVAS